MAKLMLAILLVLVLAPGNSLAEECKNTNEWCHYLTRYGACNFDEHTKTVCKKSCGLCGTPKSSDGLDEDVILADGSECEDTNVWCHYLTRYGACHHSEYTKQVCKKSCNLCN